MRLALLGVGLAATAGCGLLPEGHRAERAACARYLDCLTATVPEAVAGAVALYGDESACWASADDAARCADACEALWIDAWEEHPDEPACDASALVPARSLRDASSEWRVVEVEVLGEDVQCAPAPGEHRVTVAPGGEGATLTWERVGAGEGLTAACELDAAGLALECEDAAIPGFAMNDLSAVADAALVTLVLTFDAAFGPDEPACATWEATAEPW